MSDVAGPSAVFTVVLEMMEDLQDPVRCSRSPLRASAETSLGSVPKGMVGVGLQVCRRHAFAVCYVSVIFCLETTQRNEKVRLWHIEKTKVEWGSKSGFKSVYRI